MKRILLFLIITACTIGGSFARSFKFVYRDVTFKCNEERDGITITSFDDDADLVVIPGSVAGVPVKKVSCFINGHNYLASELVIEEGVEEIAKFCFNEFRQLRKVTVPSSLKKVNGNAFRKNNDIVFYGPDNFDVALLRRYLSHPFNGKESQVQQFLASRSADEDKVLRKKQQEEALGQKTQEKETNKSKNRRSSGGRMLAKLLGVEPVQEKIEELSPSTTPTVSVQEALIAARDLQQEVSQRRLSDVDVNIPRAKKVNESTYCFIIANEKYDELPAVNYAENDGNTFRDYCINTLGVPESQVFLYVNASFTSMTRAFRKMENLAAVTNGKSKFVFYYAGHGSPSEEDQTAYIVPSDGLVTVPSTCFSLGEIYKRFGKMEAESVVVLLDACFSGLNRDNTGLIAARAVARKPKKETVTGNVIVLSATSEAETAMGYDEKEHGMFTYHVLKKLQQTNGEVRFADLYQAVSEGVRRDAIIRNDKNQTPSLAVSPSLRTCWENMSF